MKLQYFVAVGSTDILNTRTECNLCTVLLLDALL
jgi:hypothetical protein